jgi:ATP-dependent protease HslVU (ClpYQ) ATPase subunit
LSDEGDKSRLGRLVSQARVQIQQARSQYWEQGSSGRVSESVMRDLRSSLLQYYDVLREHRGEKAIEEQWESKEFDNLPDMIFSEVSVRAQSAGHGSASRSKTVPYIQTLSAQDLVEISYDLDDVANELGFSASVDEKTTTTEVTQELVKKADERAKELKEEV